MDAFCCPRCGTDTTQQYYGPCASCRHELRDQLSAEARVIDAAYEPKMNVTPNAVALKE